MIFYWFMKEQITETEKIEDMGFSMKNVLDSFLNAFGNYLFVYGDLHVDPHPGNILVYLFFTRGYKVGETFTFEPQSSPSGDY